MKRARSLYIYIIGVILMTLVPAIGRAEYDVIDITKPFLRKIPLAVPLFKNASGANEEKSHYSELHALAEQIASGNYV